MRSRLDPNSEPVQLRVRTAHEALGSHVPVRVGVVAELPTLHGIRGLVRESWERSLSHVPVPAAAAARHVLDDGELQAHRESHPLAVVMPVIEHLLVRPCRDTGVLVAVGDQHGRLLWVEGDLQARRRAEGILFAPGTDWSERTVGTSAPGTALTLGRSVQIVGAEHFSPAVHGWSCTAVPIRDPDTGQVLGVVDLTGGAAAVAVHSLPLVQATVAAAEAELRIHRLRSNRPPVDQAPAPHPSRTFSGAVSPRVSTPRPAVGLQILGRDSGRLTVGTGLDAVSCDLSLRHSEILTMLTVHPQGLRVNGLAELINPDLTATTLRAEMVRLRRVLERFAPALAPGSRPYRLPRVPQLDVLQVLRHLDRGSRRRALDLYSGAPLPSSTAPGVARLRHRVRRALREAMLSDGSVDTLLRFLALPESADDVEAWFAALRRLPARSPKRAAIVTHLERVEAELR